jgi:hypothetical protein
VRGEGRRKKGRAGEGEGGRERGRGREREREREKGKGKGETGGRGGGRRRRRRREREVERGRGKGRGDSPASLQGTLGCKTPCPLLLPCPTLVARLASIRQVVLLTLVSTFHPSLPSSFLIPPSSSSLPPCLWRVAE